MKHPLSLTGAWPPPLPACLPALPLPVRKYAQIRTGLCVSARERAYVRKCVRKGVRKCGHTRVWARTYPKLQFVTIRYKKHTYSYKVS